MDIPPIRFVGAGFKSLFQKSPLESAYMARRLYDSTVLSIRNTAVNPVIPVKTGI